MDLINLDVDYVSPSCLTPSGKWTYSDSYYTLLVIPFIPFFFVGTLGLLAKGWAKYIKRDSIYGLRLSFMCVTDMQVRRYFLGLVNAAIPFLGIVYNNICIKSFNAFSCQTLRSGVVVMRAAPSIVCYEPEHNALVGIAILALVVYVFGVPAVTLGVVAYARSKDLLRHPDWLRSVGFFFTWYSKLSLFSGFLLTTACCIRAWTLHEPAMVQSPTCGGGV